MADKRVYWSTAALCASAVWYRVIWGFSAQNSSSSSSLSDSVLSRLMDLFVPAWHTGTAAMQADAVDTLSFFLRKGAHMTCYFVLAALLLAACSSFGIKQWKKAGLVLLSCAVLAGLDEYHQTFVQGRSGALSDVGIDLLGATAAVLLWPLLEWAVGQKKLPACIPWPVRAGGILAAVGGVLLLMALTGGAGLTLCRMLCARFLEGWRAVPAPEQTAFISWLTPVVAQTVQLILAAAVGAAAGVCRRRYAAPIPATMAGVVIWGAVAALPVGGSPLWGGCTPLFGFLLITAGALCVEIWQKTEER